MSREDLKPRPNGGQAVFAHFFVLRHCASGRPPVISRFFRCLPPLFFPNVFVRPRYFWQWFATWPLSREDVTTFVSRYWCNCLALYYDGEGGLGVVSGCNRYQHARLNCRDLHFEDVGAIARSICQGRQSPTWSRAVFVHRGSATFHVCFFRHRASIFCNLRRALLYFFCVLLCRRRVVANLRDLRYCVQFNDCSFRNRHVNGCRSVRSRLSSR